MDKEHETGAATIHVQVCYARPDHILLQDLTLSAGATIEQAIRASGVLSKFPEVDLQTCKVGIYGKIKERSTILREHDRVEIYRPLLADPMEARRRRALKKEKTC